MKSFTNLLLKWHEVIDRRLPWKESRDPYKIWLSEIILQQTRVEQGIPYYLKFIHFFPNVAALASATSEEVMKTWEGLGYYSRARNLHHTAQYIVNELNGNFPKTLQGLQQLKGVGPYTSAAIASFAYKLPHPVVDGNVLRVMSRYFGIKDPIEKSQTYKKILSKLEILIPKDRPDHFNQAMMDLGAIVCKPKLASCGECPLVENCYAFQKNEVDLLPIKAKKIAKKDRFFHYLLIKINDSFIIQKRKKGIWQGLYELPLIETSDEAPLALKEIDVSLRSNEIYINKIKIVDNARTQKHILTHQTLFIRFYILEASITKTKNINLVEQKNLSKFAFPIVIKNYLANILKIEEHD